MEFNSVEFDKALEFVNKCHDILVESVKYYNEMLTSDIVKTRFYEDLKFPKKQIEELVRDMKIQITQCNVILKTAKNTDKIHMFKYLIEDFHLTHKKYEPKWRKYENEMLDFINCLE